VSEFLSFHNLLNRMTSRTISGAITHTRRDLLTERLHHCFNVRRFNDRRFTKTSV
jgi:hypothetical protein